MKLANLATALFLATPTACGAVVDPSEDGAPTSGGPEVPEPPADGHLPPAAPPALLIEAPRAATTPGSLFAMTFEVGAPIENLVSPLATARYDVVEQKLVAISDREIPLVVELAPPTGSYTRVLVSDAIKNGGPRVEYVLCESNNVATFDPRCETATPAPREAPSTGLLTAAQWTLTLVDDVTGVPLPGCISTRANQLGCVLPARAGASYRILASASGFADLWDGSAGFGAFAISGAGFVGAHAAQSDWQCSDWYNSGSAFYCRVTNEYVRFTAIDRARLDFDPITVRITANAGSTAMATPALIWDAGNDDVPGPNF